jgi:monoamine oxidase
MVTKSATLVRAMRTIIVGAGIAGLWIADRLVHAGQSDIRILEKYDYTGGRVVSHRDGYEIGAGRIHRSHRLVAELIDRFKLTRSPLSDRATWRPLDSSGSPNQFEETWAPLVAILSSLSAETLAKHTVRELVSGSSFEALLERFPYRSEVDTMRADMALASFRAEMGTRDNYFVLAEGFSAMIRGLNADLKAAGVRIYKDHHVQNVEYDGSSYAVQVKGRENAMRADRVILALHVKALRTLPVMRDYIGLRYVQMKPLTRIYAAYPTEPCVWFAGLNKTVSDSQLRYIIPVDTTKGIIMISYTDGPDTTRWANLKGQKLVDAIQTEVRRLWPTRAIPEPLWVRPYEWTEGCTYWTPGDYDPTVESVRVLQPRPSTMPHLYVCGESFSLRQAWMEGALEHAEMLWNLHFKP